MAPALREPRTAASRRWPAHRLTDAAKPPLELRARSTQGASRQSAFTETKDGASWPRLFPISGFLFSGDAL